MLKVIQFVHVHENSFEGSYTIGREGRPGHTLSNWQDRTV